MPPSVESRRAPPGGASGDADSRPVTAGRWLLYRVGEGLWRLLLRVLRVMRPDRFKRLFTPLLGALVRCVVPSRRIVAVMDAALGDSHTPAARRALAGGVQETMAENIVDCLVQMGAPEVLEGRLDIHGREHLQAALARGRGVIALGFHLGNFVLLPAAMEVAGHPVHGLIRFLDDRRLMNLVHRHSRAFHVELIPSLPRRDAVKRVLSVLRHNGIVVMLADNLKRGELEATLFGRPVRTARGFVSLALRTNAALLPIYLVRAGSGRLKLVIEPEIEMVRTGEMGADLAANMDRVLRLLEELVRRYPDQWYWLTVKLGPPSTGSDGSPERPENAA